MQELIKKLEKVPAWIYLLVLGGFTFSVAAQATSSDIWWYMNSALNIYAGKGYTTMDGSLIVTRGPLFQFLINVSYHLFEPSLESTFIVIRLFCILNPVLIYLIGRKLFGTYTGLASALLILSSYSINFWSFRHIDAIWPCFAYLSIYIALLVGEGRHHRWYFILSGIVMGGAYLTKQAAILLVPIPVLAVLFTSDFRNRANMSGSILYITCFCLVAAPWVYYVYTKTGDLAYSFLGQDGETAASSTVSGFNFMNSVIAFVMGLVKYYSSHPQSLSSNFFIAPLFLLSWCYCLYKAVRLNRGAIVLSLCLLFLSPYVSHVGAEELRVGQLIVFLNLTYLVTGYFVIEAAGALSRFAQSKTGIKFQFLYYLPGVFLICLISLQTFGSHKKDHGNIAFLKQSSIIKHWVQSGESDNWASVKQGAVDCSNWVSENIPENTKIAVAKADTGKRLYFETIAKYPILHLPVTQSNRFIASLLDGSEKTIVFLTSQLAKEVPTNKILLMTEEDLLLFLGESDVEYIVLGLARNYLALYFDRHPGFEKVKEFGRGSYKIYKVKSLQKKENWKPVVVTKFIKYFGLLDRKKSPKRDRYISEFFHPILGWDKPEFERQMDAMTNGSGKYQVVRNLQIH